MAYGNNAPFGLRAFSHLIGGTDNIKTNANYVIDTNTPTTLNNGDPVVTAPSIADYSTINSHYTGENSIITRYDPAVILGAANTGDAGAATTLTGNFPIAGVFQSCQYWANGTFFEREYWEAGTVANSTVRAFVVDDPYVVWDIQLGTFLGSNGDDTTKFLVPASMQLQNATWPNTGAPAANPTAANSAVIGSNLALLTGQEDMVGPGRTGSLNTITKWNGSMAVPAGYRDNPLIANYGTNNPRSNPLGISTYFACPSLAGTNQGPSVADGRNEYARDESMPLKVLGFTPKPDNVPGAYGLPANGTEGTYFNTPFLNALVIINNHANKPGNMSITPTA